MTLIITLIFCLSFPINGKGRRGLLPRPRERGCHMPSLEENKRGPLSSPFPTYPAITKASRSLQTERADTKRGEEDDISKLSCQHGHGRLGGQGHRIRTQSLVTDSPSEWEMTTHGGGRGHHGSPEMYSHAGHLACH